MFQNNFGDTVFGIGFLIAAVYNGATSMGYLRKFGSYSRSLKICEDPELEIADAKDYIKKFDKELKTHAPVVLRGVAIHREYDERVKLGLPNSEDFKQLDLYVKTTEISHGYIKDIKYHASNFYLDGGEKVLVELDDESYTPIAGVHVRDENEKKSYFYFPLYLLGLTSITSFNVEYLSSSDTLNVCGVVDYNASTSEFSIAEPLVVFIGTIKDAINKIKEKVSFNLKWGVIYGTAAVIFGGLCIYQFKSLLKRNALTVEKAILEDKCICCRNNAPKMLRRPCMHICECKYCYEINKQRNLELNKQCPRQNCGILSTDVKEIRSE